MVNYEKEKEKEKDKGKGGFKKIKIVDEQTGRVLDGRRYSDGLHQAIEAKEGVNVEDASQTYATITLQNYFRMYHKLGGMTGTAETEAGEFWTIYKLDVVSIPTNRVIQRKDAEDKVYRTVREKFNAVIEDVAAANGATVVDVNAALSRAARDGIIGALTEDLIDTSRESAAAIAALSRLSSAFPQVIAIGTIDELVATDHPWIQQYFMGPRGRAAERADTKRDAQALAPNQASGG